jgi:hypothetical protein
MKPMKEDGKWWFQSKEIGSDKIKSNGPFNSEAEASSKRSEMLRSTQRDFRGVVNRDQEERNRQESYDRTGIQRVETDDGGPGSGPQPQGGSKYIEKKNLSPNTKSKEGTTYYTTKPKTKPTLWQRLRYGGK